MHLVPGCVWYPYSKSQKRANIDYLWAVSIPVRFQAGQLCTCASHGSKFNAISFRLIAKRPNIHSQKERILLKSFPYSSDPWRNRLCDEEVKERKAKGDSAERKIIFMDSRYMSMWNCTTVVYSPTGIWISSRLSSNTYCHQNPKYELNRFAFHFSKLLDC